MVFASARTVFQPAERVALYSCCMSNLEHEPRDQQ
jgi:hypothetical protein